MKVYCTYCSGEKSPSEHLLPAIERYTSRRIQLVYKMAMESDIRCFILSGKYGLIDSKQPIANYDHLLKEKEVNKHSQLVADQLLQNGIRELVFFIRNKQNDPNLKPYIRCMELASQKAKTSLILSELDF